MTRPPSPRSNVNTSLLIGLWLGLTLVAGASVFGLFYWALSNGGESAPTPVAVAPTEFVLPTAAPATAPPTTGGDTASACKYPAPPASGFGYGIQSHVFVGDNAYWLGVITDKLNLHWLKVQVRWEDVEKSPGDIDWGVLDHVMQVSCDKGLRVMLSVVTAPAWTHASPMPPERGAAPPDDYALYGAFIGKILDRYPGQVGAIEVWNEMNLEREWNTAAGVNVAEYLRLLQVAHDTIRGRDAQVVIISGALSPTGINCNVSFPDCQPEGRPIVVDDVTYLTEFVRAGGLALVDCIGTHSNGTNLPPTADGAQPPGRAGQVFGGPWDNPHYSWALKSQVETYAQVVGGQKPQCVTEFGYASAIEGQYPPNFGFAADVSEQQQAEYLVEAFNWMRASGLVKMAFLFNLDYGPKGGDPATDDNVNFSILDKAGAPRPAFDALSQMPKS